MERATGKEQQVPDLLIASTVNALAKKKSTSHSPRMGFLAHRVEANGLRSMLEPITCRRCLRPLVLERPSLPHSPVSQRIDAHCVVGPPPVLPKAANHDDWTFHCQYTFCFVTSDSFSKPTTHPLDSVARSRLCLTRTTELPFDRNRLRWQSEIRPTSACPKLPRDREHQGSRLPC